MVEPETIVARARGWLGTPYHHQASVKGVGCDCLGLIRGLWREMYGPVPEAMPAYTRDWGNATGSETLIAAACRHLIKLGDVRDAVPGDVLVFRMRDGGVAKHAGLISALPARSDALSRGALHERNGLLERDKPALMIHAQEGLGVVEIPLGRWWRRRAVAAFRFPSL
jgi:NlpC/P60 family putative phage cell wall peptidase